VVLVPIWLFGHASWTLAADLDFRALSADQLSVSVTGQAPGMAPAQAFSMNYPESFRARSGIMITNQVTDASSRGQAATSIAVHATLDMQPRAVH
jgi:hypothetical protein